MTRHAVLNKQSMREWCNVDRHDEESLLQTEGDYDTGKANVLTTYELVPEACCQWICNHMKTTCQAFVKFAK